MKTLSIVIPCYNEAQSLPHLFASCKKACNNRTDIEFIFVNNGSTDNSKEVFKTLFQDPANSFALSCDIALNIGYGHGILEGLRKANGNILGWTHADLQTDPGDVIIAYEKFKNDLTSKKCIVKGKRIGRNLFDVLFTTGMSIFAYMLLSARLSDINAQPKLFHRDLFFLLDKAPHDFSLDLYFLYSMRKNGIEIKTFPVSFEKREFGESKGGGTIKGKIRLIRRTITLIFDLRRSVRKEKM